ncbi:FAD-dependent thymidylate synthase [Bacillota bacterium LX-D]|nr:FAD-dependent thymidylate synthase [Bacillota bacterium LX-D]
MLIQKPQVFVPASQLGEEALLKLERYGRVCYKSEEKTEDKYNPNFFKTLLKGGHESVIEHEKVTVLFVVDRGISHEIVRHRIGSYSQESTRYCNYAKEKFGQEIVVIEPYFLVGKDGYHCWKKACLSCEENYLEMLDLGCTPQEARSVLPNSLKTEIVVTFNFREWRHFFKLRASQAAHPQIRQVAIPLLLLFQEKLPALFKDIEYDTSFQKEHYGEIVLTDDLFQKIEN